MVGWSPRWGEALRVATMMPCSRRPLSPGDGGLGQAGAGVEDGSLAGGDPGDHLGEGDRVGVALEAEGAADDVEQHPELVVGERGQEHVEELVRDLGVVGRGEAGKGWIGGGLGWHGFQHTRGGAGPVNRADVMTY